MKTAIHAPLYDGNIIFANYHPHTIHKCQNELVTPQAFNVLPPQWHPGIHREGTTEKLPPYFICVCVLRITFEISRLRTVLLQSVFGLFTNTPVKCYMPSYDM